jgi:hypothetical protein
MSGRTSGSRKTRSPVYLAPRFGLRLMGLLPKICSPQHNALMLLGLCSNHYLAPSCKGLFSGTSGPLEQPPLSQSQLMSYVSQYSKPVAYFAWPLSHTLGVAGLLGLGLSEANLNPDRAQGIAGGIGLTAGGLLGANMLGFYGAQLGATLGSFFPGLGTLLGTAIGGGLGAAAGAFLGSQCGLALGRELVSIYRRSQEDTDARLAKIIHWVDHHAPPWLRRVIG